MHEQVLEEIEPNNPVDKYAVAVKKREIVGYQPLRKLENLQKRFLNLLRTDQYRKFDITVNAKAVNLEDGDGMQVPSVPRLSGQKSMIEMFKQQTSIK